MNKSVLIMFILCSLSLLIALFAIGNTHNEDNLGSTQTIATAPTEAQRTDPDGSRGDMGCYPFDHPYDTKVFTKGWNWVSFPRLQREPATNGSQNCVPLFETISGFESITLFDMYYYDYRLYHKDIWIPGSYDIFSTNLYKIDIDPEDNWMLTVPGNRMAPDYAIQAPGGGNFLGDGTWYWLGYWIFQNQDMDVAFGDNWQYIKEVKAEEWYYGPQPTNNRDIVVEHTPSLTMRSLEYGKGYMVKFVPEAEGLPVGGLSSFRWFTGEEGAEGYERDATEYFTYAEQPDYEVVDIMGIPENVVEIGVFQDSVCVGAVAVKDSCEQILLYPPATTRSLIPYTFEVVTNLRARSSVSNYRVFNAETGSFEPNTLVAGHQSYSLVRLAAMENEPQQTPPVTTATLHGNYPNPFNPETTIAFTLPEEQKVTLSVYNIRGQCVRKLIDGTCSSGTHTMVWDGRDHTNKQVGSGLYFYKLKTGKKEISKKMLLLK